MGIVKDVEIEVTEYDIANYIAHHIDCEDFAQIINYIGEERNELEYLLNALEENQFTTHGKMALKMFVDKFNNLLKY